MRWASSLSPAACFAPRTLPELTPKRTSAQFGRQGQDFAQAVGIVDVAGVQADLRGPGLERGDGQRRLEVDVRHDRNG